MYKKEHRIASHSHVVIVCLAHVDQRVEQGSYVDSVDELLPYVLRLTGEKKKHLGLITNRHSM